MIVGWLALVAWAIPVFVVTEALVPRRRQRIAWRAIAFAAVLVGVDALVMRSFAFAPTRGTALRSVAAFGVAELLAYVVHRAMHHVPVLWRFHRLHHTDEPLAWHVAWRIHPIDAALFALANVAACYAVGAPLPASIAFVVGRRVWTIVIHANVAWPQSALDALIATPAFHRRHHEEARAAANFASTFPIIDRVFGTLSTPSRS
jgi:sterol desaturase/sphingolipid hydroxylase (fatty acid hydroxylase superfamily)